LDLKKSYIVHVAMIDTINSMNKSNSLKSKTKIDQIKYLNEMINSQKVSFHISEPGVHFALKIRPEVLEEYLKRDTKELNVWQKLALITKISGELNEKRR